MGKVHGGLARAGKVRSQTPKVERTANRKKLTGRAKKRAQYLKRVVNVTLLPGGRKPGCNPQAIPITMADKIAQAKAKKEEKA